MNDIDLVIFDYDGVLVDTELISCAVDAAELTRLGFTISVQEVVERFCGISDEEMIRLLESDTGRHLPSDYSSKKVLLLEEALANRIRIMPGASEALACVTKPVSVASNTSSIKLDAELKRIGLYDRFSPHIFTARMVARPKPAPDLFQLVANELGVAPNKCLVIEDSIAGVQAAVAAKMRVYGFYGGEHCFPGHSRRLLDSGATLVFNELAKLPDLLG